MPRWQLDDQQKLKILKYFLIYQVKSLKSIKELEFLWLWDFHRRIHHSQNPSRNAATVTTSTTPPKEQRLLDWSTLNIRLELKLSCPNTGRTAAQSILLVLEQLHLKICPVSLPWPMHWRRSFYHELCCATLHGMELLTLHACVSSQHRSSQFLSHVNSP